MDCDGLRQCITKVNEKVNEWNVPGFNENQVKTSIIQPIFNSLGWDISDPVEVKLEFNLPPEGRVDYAFFGNSGPLIFVEAKAPSINLEDHTSQLLKYAYTKDVKLAVLTNGLEWWLYLPREGGDWDDRKFYSIDLMKQNVETICEKFICFLGKKNVLSGEALNEAKKMRKSAERDAKIKKALPKVWNAIVTEPHDKLIDLLMEETEGDCGFKPDEVKVKEFLQRNRQNLIMTEQTPLPTGAKKALYYGGDRKPKISLPREGTREHATIELLKEKEEKERTFEKLLEALLKKFPNDDPEVLRRTTKRRLGGHLKKFGVEICKDDNGVYSIK